jgi:hypothetical protein
VGSTVSFPWYTREMPRLFIACFALAFALGSLSATAQTAAPAIAAAGGAYVVKKEIGACVRHPVLCTATVIAGAGAVYATKQRIKKLDAETPACSDGYVSLYRAVGTFEHAEIATIQRYVLVPGGIEKKEFFLDIANAQWLAAFNRRYETSPTKEIFIVTSKVCTSTFALGEKFADANRPATAFDAVALKYVNLDAARTGGIQTVWTTGAAK